MKIVILIHKYIIFVEETPLEAIPEQYRALYNARKNAVDMYIDGQKSSDITQRTGIDYTNISRLIKKCLRTNCDGDYYGYQALIPKVKLHNTSEKQVATGRFIKLLTTYPSLKDFIAGNYFGDKKYTLEKNMNLTTLHQKFLKECLRLGVQEHEYPFNTENRAYVSLSKYIKILQKENINKQATRENKNNRQKIYSTGIGKRYSKTALAPFQAVQVDELQTTVSFGSVATPETRGIIERFFGSLETRGFHQLPMTTGSNINDVKRQDPEAAALKYNITYDQIVELLEALIATYNNTPHSGIENLTPLESMRKKIFEAGMMPTLAEEDMIQTINELNFQTETRKVVGGKNGKRAYIDFKGAEYRSRELSLTGCYIGQTITIRYNPRDISTVEAYTAEGMHIGTLFAKGEFGRKSHSVKTRKIANKLARKRGRAKLEFDTPIAALEQQLSDSGKKSRRDATKADIIRREQKAPTPSELANETKNKEKIVQLKQNIKNTKELTYEDVKDLTPEELYELMYGTRRG